MKIRVLEIGAGEIGTGQVAAFEVSPGEIAAWAFARATGEEICTLVGMCERRRQRGQDDQARCRRASRCRDVPAHAANLSTARRLGTRIVRSCQNDVNCSALAAPG